MRTLPMTREQQDCWNRIGVSGDRSCPELAHVVHCHNCPVFCAAGRRFLDNLPPDGYLEEWTARLAEDKEDEIADVQGVVLFRLGGEWLALPAFALREVISIRPIHRIPFHGGLLAGVVNVRGELHLAIRMDHLLGLTQSTEADGDRSRSGAAQMVPRLLVAGRDAETWVFRVDEVDRVHRLARQSLQAVPPTLGRSLTRFTRGVFRLQDRAVGLLDEGRLFEAVRTSVR
jgi:chemotaxis-related protein WspD